MRHVAWIWVLATVGGPAWAQAPSISELFPAGARAGTQISATLSGKDLKSVTALEVSGSGVRVEAQPGGTDTSLPVRLVVDAGAELGERELRLVTAGGVSNAARIWVGRFPEVVEKEPNNTRAQAQELTSFPVTVNGRADKAEDADCYAFQAAAGETWVFGVTAARLHSQFDGYLTLYDARGRVLDSAMDNLQRDPRLVHTFKSAGKYVIEVRDTLYHGGPGYAYRLNVGKLPVITRYAPMGGQRGSTVKVQLQGINLGALRTLDVAVPKGTHQRTVQVAPNTPAGAANPVELFVDDEPEVVEHEPNDTPATAQRLPAVPIIVSGFMDHDGDKDTYVVSLREKQAVRIDVLAQRIRSRMDGVLRVLDHTGKEIASNDDAVGTDPRLLFTAPAAGDYYLEVRDLGNKGGDDYYYRLKVENPPAPDFALTFTPDALTVPSGAAAVVTVTARRTGYNGPIRLHAEGLPAGVAASEVTLPEGQTTAVFTLAAPAGTKPGYSRLRVQGTAEVGGQAVARAAVGVERYQPPLTTQPKDIKTRETELTLVAVGPEPAYTLQPEPQLTTKPGKAEWAVKLTRKPGNKDDVAVTLLGLPAGVQAAPLTIKGAQSEGKVALTIPANAKAGTIPVVVQGTAKNVVVAAPAVTLTIQPAK